MKRGALALACVFAAACVHELTVATIDEEIDGGRTETQEDAATEREEEPQERDDASSRDAASARPPSEPSTHDAGLFPWPPWGDAGFPDWPGPELPRTCSDDCPSRSFTPQCTRDWLPFGCPQCRCCDDVRSCESGWQCRRLDPTRIGWCDPPRDASGRPIFP